MKDTLPYKEGFAAAAKGMIPPNNPYKKDSYEYDCWLEGLIDGSL